MEGGEERGGKRDGGRGGEGRVRGFDLLCRALHCIEQFMHHVTTYGCVCEYLLLPLPRLCEGMSM